jgi:four helix bundle protein
MSNRNYDLEDRLINFSVLILDLTEKFPNSYSSKHLGSQLIRSGTSPALNYGEVQSAESAKDFIHKMKVCLKELRESHICLKIISKKNYVNSETINPVIQECSELVAIFTSSIKTADKK